MSYKIPYKKTQKFSKLILDYLNEDKKIKPFVNHFPNLKNFQKQIIEKNNSPIDRKILVEALESQNSNLSLSKESKKNIELLALDVTFSITTGHQLCLFTGPLYFIYKIVSTIKLAEQLKFQYPKNNFVPIFWMASEDHDFKEVNHIYSFGKIIEWEGSKNGAVGEISLDGFQSVLSELKSMLGSNEDPKELISLFEFAYLNNHNLADATRYLVNALFGKYGLVIIDGNDKNLKKKFIPYIKKDILRNGFVDTIKECSKNLSKDYKKQAFVRDINFFRLSEGSRDLIKEKVDEQEIIEHPERFSPNVLLRTLYQEIILPNIGYVGGQAELAYWMQLKTAFSQEKTPFPILVLRNSALLIDQKQQQRFEKFGFQLEDLFLSEDQLNKQYLLTHFNSEISLKDEKKQLQLLYQKIEIKTKDEGLRRSVRAQLQKQLSSLDNLHAKFIKIQKKNHEVSINQISKIKKQLFPNNFLQERYDNFIPFYLRAGNNFIKILQNNFDPLNPNFVVLTI